MAESSEFIIRYLADTNDLKKRLKEIETINKTSANRFGKEFGRNIDIVSSKLKNFRDVKVFNEKGVQTGIKTLAQFETVVKGADGRLRTISETSQITNGRLKTLNTTIRDGATTSRTFGQNLATLAKRALLTIPIWFALRTAIFGVFRTIRDGLKDVVEFDRALQKLRRNIEATSTNVEGDFQRIQGAVEQFSLRTGKSVTEITNAIQKFATVGFDIETSLEGGLRATQLAITLFGDAEDTANAFARSLRVLTEGIDDPAEQQRQIAEALALTDQLWQTNAFEVNEFSNNLEKFAGTARIANLSIEDTLTLLATLSTGGLSNRAGRLLRTTVLKSLSDIENITNTLNLDFDPNTQPTIVFIQELVKSLGNLRSAEGAPVELAETLAELFSIRSTEPLAALTALQDTLNENLALTPDVEKFDSTLERLLGTTGSLAEQFTNVTRALGRVFVRGLVGGDDFEDSLQTIVNFLRNSVTEVEDFGIVLSGLGTIISEVASRAEIFANVISLGTVPLVKQALNLFVELKRTERALEDITEASKEFQKSLGEALSGNLDVSQLERVIAGIETRLRIDTIDPELDRNTLQNVLNILKERLEVEKDITEEKEKQEEQTKKQRVAENDRKEIAKLVLATELESLKLRGARESQLIKAEQLIRDSLNIEKEKIDQLADQLKLQEAINEEKRLESTIGNESLKLFRIAQQEGTEVARRIGEVLSGEADFSTFVRRGGKELDIFKRDFEDIFENQQAQRFFSGDTVPGLPGLRGGTRIPIREEAIRTPVSQIRAEASLAQRRAEDAFRRLNIPKTDINAERVTINSPRPIEVIQREFEEGGIIRGTEAQRLVESSVQGQQRRIIDLNLSLDGRNFNFAGTPEAVRALARQITSDPNVLSALETQIVNALANPQSTISQSVNDRIEEF